MRVLAIIAATVCALSAANADPIIEATYGGDQGLNDLAKRSGKYMGTATELPTTAVDAPYLKELDNGKDWGWLTPANAMKWESTEFTPGNFTFADGDALIAQANKIGAKARCHVLTWHSQTPKWVQVLPRDEMLAALKNHITTVMTHFGDSCSHWDVLNEAIEEDGSYRKSFWYNTTGTEFIKVAFETASAVKKQLGLKTKLFYNDYNTDAITPKTDGVIKNIIKFLQDQNIEINGMGIQGHLIVGNVGTKAEQIASMKRFTDLGLEVAITELDIRFQSAFPAPNPISPTAAQQWQQAQDYQNTIAACKDLPGCLGVTVWDFSDQWSWITNDLPCPFYQPGGRGSEVKRKAPYDGIVRGWGYNAC